MLPMLLTLALIVVLGGALAAFALSPGRRTPESVSDAPAVTPQRSRFFVSAARPEVSDEVLFSRIEQYVRTERAAVESFPDQPRAEDLRAPNHLN